MRIFYLFFALLTLTCPVVAGTDPQRGIDLIEQASARSNIFELPAFTLKADVQIDNFGKPIHGTYSLLWKGADQWREELSLPGYAELQIGGKGLVFIKRSTNYMPYQIFKLRQALGFGTNGSSFFNLGPHGRETVKKVRDEKIAGAKATCIEIATEANYTREVCIDQSAGAISRTKGGIIDSDPIAIANKIFPGSILVRKDKNNLVEVHITGLKTGVAAQSAFEPPTGTISRPGCMNPILPRKINNVAPHYPDLAKLALHQGTVGIYTRIDASGIPQDFEIALNATPELNAAAIDAIRQWRYEPATCDGKPVEAETIIEVNFALSGTDLPRAH